ncbi:MAG: hypothetical protein A2Z52_02735 [Candidatus Moranbacteria bacterium RBG_19FT_COMBO_42_6]|nr:MAG: hypothetical protein A2Z52_02735 [Candidatus Moranbacteria bacterium RBG_19FT_COMBO_42_6]
MKKIISIVIAVAIILGGIFYFRYQVYYSHGDHKQNKAFEITKGEGNAQVSARLKNEGLISGDWYFYYYLRSHGLLNKILPGKYELNGNMAIPEIALYITQAENILPGYVKITFPEGWESKKMADRLTANGFDGVGFLEIMKNPSQEITDKFEFLEGVKNLEGYLFPDTYFLTDGLSAEKIVLKILDNFDSKVTVGDRQEIQRQKKDLGEIITMASIIEREVRSDEDRKIVSGIFWGRIKSGQALQSCATLAFILGENKKQYSIADTQIKSPYNTYQNTGLTPGPISNPGLSAIEAAIYPQNSVYNYFLSDPETGQTIFSQSLEEHNANKAKYGL